MSYGLYDVDLKYYPVPFYNLELMKISAYYKRKREIVGLSPSFTPNLYNNFIVRQDFYYPVSFPFHFSNVQYGGRVFDGEHYKPLPYEIEVMRPDKSLYSKVKPNEYRKTPLNVMQHAEHVRLSLDEKTIWKDFERQLYGDKRTTGVIFHDYNLNTIEGAHEFIKDNIDTWVSHLQCRSIGMKYPVITNTNSDLLKWLTIRSISEYYALEHDYIIENNIIDDINEIKQFSNAWRFTKINVTKNYSYEYLITEGLQRLYRSIVNLRTRRIAFPLIYDENVFVDEEWKKVIKLIDYYDRHLVHDVIRKRYDLVERYESMYSYSKNLLLREKPGQRPFFIKDNIKGIFQFLRENNYELFKDFYEYRGEEVR